MLRCAFPFFFFNDTATTEIYTLSLHDALPISLYGNRCDRSGSETGLEPILASSTRLHDSICPQDCGDRKSTRLNSSHQIISYAVFCFKKKTKHDDSAVHLHQQLISSQSAAAEH